MHNDVTDCGTRVLGRVWGPMRMVCWTLQCSPPHAIETISRVHTTDLPVVPGCWGEHDHEDGILTWKQKYIILFKEAADIIFFILWAWTVTSLHVASYNTEVGSLHTLTHVGYSQTENWLVLDVYLIITRHILSCCDMEISCHFVDFKGAMDPTGVMGLILFVFFLPERVDSVLQ